MALQIPLKRAITSRQLSPYIALIPVCLGVFVAADDQTVVVTVLPQIMVDMKIQVTELDRVSWAITGYLLGYLAAMPLIGRLSDVLGHRRLYVASMLLFMAGSVAVAISPSLPLLVVSRIVQAVGAGALLPISIAIVGDIFPSGRRGLPMGLVGAAAEAGGVIGPLWGGLVSRYMDWRWVFWANLPLAVLVLLLLVVLIKSSPRIRAEIDYIGGLLIAASLALLTLGLARVSSPDFLLVIYIVAFVVTFAGFILRQRVVREPLIPISMFRSKVFNAASISHILIGGALIIAMVTVPLMANTSMGRSALEGGLWLMRMTAAMPVGAIIGGLACQRMDCRIPSAAGLLLAATGFFFICGWDLSIAEPELTIHLMMAGLGFGLLIAPIALAATESVKSEVRGSAASMVSATRMLGMTAGLAALTAWGSARFDLLLTGINLPFPLPGETAEQAEQRVAEFNAQLQAAGMTLFNEFFLVAAVICLVALVPVALMSWRWRAKQLPFQPRSNVSE